MMSRRVVAVCIIAVGVLSVVGTPVAAIHSIHGENSLGFSYGTDTYTASVRAETDSNCMTYLGATRCDTIGVRIWLYDNGVMVRNVSRELQHWTSIVETTSDTDCAQHHWVSDTYHWADLFDPAVYPYTSPHRNSTTLHREADPNWNQPCQLLVSVRGPEERWHAALVALRAAGVDLTNATWDIDWPQVERELGEDQFQSLMTQVFEVAYGRSTLGDLRPIWAGNMSSGRVIVVHPGRSATVVDFDWTGSSYSTHIREVAVHVDRAPFWPMPKS